MCVYLDCCFFLFFAILLLNNQIEFNNNNKKNQTTKPNIITTTKMDKRAKKKVCIHNECRTKNYPQNNKAVNEFNWECVLRRIQDSLNQPNKLKNEIIIIKKKENDPTSQPSKPMVNIQKSLSLSFVVVVVGLCVCIKKNE